jgi:hypothetical protein
MKMFKVLDEDTQGIAIEKNLTLTCNALMKFLPYKGFYPAQRTLELASLYSSSYAGPADAPHVFMDGGSFRTFLQPFFGPGLLYNAIKSGVAVEYPLYTDPATYNEGAVPVHVVSQGNIDYLASSPDKQLPFNALVEPENYLRQVYDVERSGSAATYAGTTTWDGLGSPLYKLAMHNFLAETIDFFLEDGQLTSFASLPDDHPDFGITEPDKTYIMDVKLRGSLEDSAAPKWMPAPSGNMMYNSDPIPNKGVVYFDEDGRTGPWPGYAASSRFGPLVDMSDDYKSLGTAYWWRGGTHQYTPPHYDTPAYARIKFHPPRNATEDQKYTMEEIVSNVTVEYYHSTVTEFDDLGFYSGPDMVNWMQVSGTLNIGGSTGVTGSTGFAIVPVTQISYDAISGRPLEANQNFNGKVMIIQPRWETPMFDFRSGSLAARGCSPTILKNSSSLATNAGPWQNQMVRGIWHQYGEKPTGSAGIFMEIADPAISDIKGMSRHVPILTNWTTTKANEFDLGATGSLADLMGFQKESKRLGMPRKSKIIKEAVVAIPYQEKSNGEKIFYELDRQEIEEAKRKIEEKVLVPFDELKRPIYEMVKKMKDYVFPPKFDFMTFEEITPFSMYIFEFEHKLKEKDITDIWQNLPPDEITDNFKSAKATITHEIFRNDFLQLSPRGRKARTITDVRWLVFKVKQKAKQNYFAKTADSNDDKKFRFDFQYATPTSKKGSSPLYSYNWPYDFFSLVELIKIDAEIEFDTGNYPDEE